MDRISEVLLKSVSIGFVRQLLDSFKTKQLIDIRQDISDQEILATINDILPVEAPQETVSVHHVEIVKSDYKGTEPKILKAIESCNAEGIKVTVRGIAERTGISKSTVGRYMKKLK